MKIQTPAPMRGWGRGEGAAHSDVENRLVLPQQRRLEAPAHVFCAGDCGARECAVRKGAREVEERVECARDSSAPMPSSTLFIIGR